MMVHRYVATILPILFICIHNRAHDIFLFLLYATRILLLEIKFNEFLRFLSKSYHTSHSGFKNVEVPLAHTIPSV